ncbi:arp2/3 complex subunit [Malassezia sp. CBS 17886]|nr:arp2/3 complex subunit [Malassezia sp. CBS 17886]
MSDFRLLDVDQYDDEALTAADLDAQDPRSAQELQRTVQEHQTRVRACLASGDTAGALTEILADPPYGGRAGDARRATFALLADVLNATRSADITPALEALDTTQRDTLMKFLYKGLALGASPAGSAPGVNCAIFLGWHEKVAGTGCIMRVMTDRRVF